MNTVLRFLPCELMMAGRCIYRTEDMVLEYESSAPRSEDVGPPALADVINQKFGLERSKELLLIADTLTLTFSGSDHHLSGFDAYTNKQLWNVSSLPKVPEIRRQGLLIAEPASFEDDRYSLCSIPKYEIASNQQWVRVAFSEEISDFHYEVASNLVVGLKNGMVTDIYLLDVAFL